LSAVHWQIHTQNNRILKHSSKVCTKNLIRKLLDKKSESAALFSGACGDDQLPEFF
jgi:hypothetical protein